MFVHLRTHTEFSVVDSTVRIDALVNEAKADQQPALAITDLSNLYGAIKFYQASRNLGIKPIIGVDVWVHGLGAHEAETKAIKNSGQQSGLTRLALLVQNQIGYLHLCELIGRAWTEPQFPNQAVILWDWLAQKSDGLIALSGAASGLTSGALAQALLHSTDVQQSKLTQVVRQLQGAFPNRWYIELQRVGYADEESYIAKAVQLADQIQVPVVATHPVQFIKKYDYEAHEARICIAEGEVLSNPRRVRKFTNEQYFKSTEEMQALFADIPSAISNTVTIAKRCNLTLTLGKAQLPHYPTPVRDGKAVPVASYFHELTLAGLEERLLRLYPNTKDYETHRAKYVERLEFEIKTILKMEFAGYFLIVADFINWAKKNGCPVGPGRGSGAGSLVAYVLKITDVDPLRYGLLFERFLNPDRVSMPDFDIDFCQANRDSVIDYVKRQYGASAVSQIATFGTMAARAAVRDVGRVLDMSYNFVDGISKLIPNKQGQSMTLAKAIEVEPLLAERLAKEEDVKTLLDLAQKLEGLTRNVGMHAGGVVIAPGKLTDFCPLYQQPGSDSVVSQYDKDDVEAIGLVKFDFLGLATLTILESIKKMLQERHPSLKNFSFDELALDDPKVYQLFSEGNTEAVFQFESPGMRGTLRDAKPNRIEELLALNAIFRPGPMEMVPTFVARKHGREEVIYPHPSVEDVLKETYGIMVYQEQVMQVAQILGGYTLGGADLLRRAMGKKKPEEMAKHRAIFLAGAAKHHLDELQAGEIFDLMEKFAGYGFNKSHAAVYSLLAYHTAWVKTYYPSEFYCANMTVEMGDTDKLRSLYEDALKNNISCEWPNINEGRHDFIPLTEQVIRYGLGAVKGTGRQAIEAIIHARETDGEGPFKSLFDFVRRVDKTKMNKRVVQALIKAGAFDTLCSNRAALLASSDLAFDFAQAREKNADQGGLFDSGDDQHGASHQEPPLVEATPWTIVEQLTHEKKALGFYMSAHMFDFYESEVRQFVSKTLADLVNTSTEAVYSADTFLVAGIVVSEIRQFSAKNRRSNVFVFKLDDKTATMEASIDESLIKAMPDALREDQLVIVQVKLQTDRNSGGYRLKIHHIWDLPSARCRFSKFLAIKSDDLAKTINVLKLITKNFPARKELTEQGEFVKGVDVRLEINKQQAGLRVTAQMQLGDKARFFPSDEALASWREHLDEKVFSLVY